MKELRRSYTKGGSYFFTVVTNNRQPILCEALVRHALRHAIQSVRAGRPFEIVAWVLLPDHLHTIWTLPEGDSDYSTRWRLLKGIVSHQLKDRLNLSLYRSQSQIKKGESGLWQHRFWEHTIRDEEDFAKYFDYIHFNPVKHGFAEDPQDWKWSTYHRYLKNGFYGDDRQIIGRDLDIE